jgi:hypothetical protein
MTEFHCYGRLGRHAAPELYDGDPKTYPHFQDRREERRRQSEIHDRSGARLRISDNVLQVGCRARVERMLRKKNGPVAQGPIVAEAGFEPATSGL